MKIAPSSHLPALLAVLLLSAAGSCRRPHPGPATSHFPAFETNVILHIGATDLDKLALALNTSRTVTKRIERLFARNEPHSEIAILNRVAANVSLPVSRETARAVGLSLALAASTRGTFDITTEPLEYIWGFNSPRPPRRPPSADLVRAALEGVGYHKVTARGNRISFDSPLTALNLDHIARGYAIDRSLKALQHLGIRNCMISIGRHSRCLGTPSPGTHWELALPDPSSLNANLGTITLTNSTAVTALLRREHQIRIGDRLYSTILDPRNGRPVEHTALSVVLAPNALTADALAVAVFVGGIEETPRILAGNPGTEVLLIPESQHPEIWISKGFLRVWKHPTSLTRRVHVIPAASAPENSPY